MINPLNDMFWETRARIQDQLKIKEADTLSMWIKDLKKIRGQRKE